MLDRWTNDVETFPKSGVPIIDVVMVPVHTAGL